VCAPCRKAIPHLTELTLERQHSPDYGLLLAAEDRALAENEKLTGWTKAWNTEPLSSKAEVYSVKGDIPHALATYQLAVEAAKAGGNAEVIKPYEQKLAHLKQRQRS